MADASKTGERTARAEDPFFWLVQAKDLDRAAMLIWSAIRDELVRISQFPVGTVIRVDVSPVNLGGVFWLNAGMALENLLKGMIIADKPHLANGGRLDRSIRTHDLCVLAKRASVKLSVMDAFFLWVGTQCVMWAGRYPSSLRPGETKPPVFSEADVDAYTSLFDRFASRFDASEPRHRTISRLV